jgi:tRNA threonylcarbamoyladenosine biosynthesis protein TsaB
MAHGQAEALLPMVEEAMRAAGRAVSALDLIAVTIGPGSFTGIRVGLAAARGIALAARLPLIGVSSFEAAAATAPRPVPGDRCLLVALESRRADLYVQLFDHEGRPLCEPAAVLPDALAATVDAVVDAATGACALSIAGDAARRAALVLAGRDRTIVVEDLGPPALGLAQAALRRWRSGERGERVKPLYLRPPDATPAEPRAPHQR